MTKKEFKENLLRGRGRCVAEVKENPEKYRDLVLWACTHDLSFDTQCEGTRAWLVHQLAVCYPDCTPFVDAAAGELKKYRSNGSWKFAHLCDLLVLFAADGNELAKSALKQKYCEMYAVLAEGKQPRRNRLFPERDDFQSLCIIMATDEQSTLKIAADIGRLYQSGRGYDGSDFSQFYTCSVEDRLPALEKAAKKSVDIDCFMDTQNKWERKWEEQRKAPVEYPRTGIGFSRWLAKKADGETVLQYAEKYVTQTEPAERAEALRAFCRCPYPGDPTPIIDDARSDFEELRVAAWTALENIRHPAVREFALASINSGQLESADAVTILAKNYEPADSVQLEKLVRAVPVDWEETFGWHWAQTEVLNMAADGSKAPLSLLWYIYETTYCSCCRETALRQLGKRHALTQVILQECLYDSREGIRNYAAQCLKRRK